MVLETKVDQERDKVQAMKGILINKGLLVNQKQLIVEK